MKKELTLQSAQDLKEPLVTSQAGAASNRLFAPARDVSASTNPAPGIVIIANHPRARLLVRATGRLGRCTAVGRVTGCLTGRGRDNRAALPSALAVALNRHPCGADSAAVCPTRVRRGRAAGKHRGGE